MGKVKSYLLDIDKENNADEADYFEHSMNNPFLDIDIKESKIQNALEDIEIEKARGK